MNYQKKSATSAGSTIAAPNFQENAIATAVAAALVVVPSVMPLRAIAQDHGLEEITVTATRRSQSVQDVPYSISAVLADELESGRTFSLSDLSRAVVGIAYLDQGPVSRGNNNNFTMRGLNVQSASNNTSLPNQGASAVSTYFGETPVFYPLKLKDIERVEVLRGPQGTLYGSGSVGGTVRFIPKQPDLQDSFISVDGSVGSTDQSDDLNYSADFVVNLPMADDTFALRLAAGYEQYAGFVDGLGIVELNGLVPTLGVPGDINSGFNLLPRQEDINESDSVYSRLSFLWQASDNVDLKFLYQHEENTQDDQQVSNAGASAGLINLSTGEVPGSLFIDNGSCAVGIAFPGNYYCGYGLPFPSGSSTYPASDEYEHTLGKNEPYESNFDLFSLDINVDFGFATLTSATSYYEVEEEYGANVTGLFSPTTSPDGVAISSFYLYYPRLLDTEFNSSTADGFVQELRLVSTWDRGWDFIAGLYYQDSSSSITIDQRLPGILEWDQANFGFHANPQLGDQALFLDRGQDFTDQAAFGEVTFHLTDAWQVTGGVRTFRQELDASLFQQFYYCGAACAEDAVFDIFGFPIGGDPLGTTSDRSRESVSDTKFKINTSYDINDDLKVYALVAEGFRRGGANSITTTGPAASLPKYLTYQPDEITNFEIGLKGVANSMTYSIAAYLNEWDKFQFEDTNPSGFPYVVNGSEAETRGLEIEVRGNISDSFSYNVGYAYTDTEVQADFTVDDLPPLALPFGLPAIDNATISKGDRIPNVPEHSFTAALDYSHLFMQSSKTLDWHLNGSYRDSVASGFNPTNKFGVGYFEMPSFWTWNAAVTLSADKWNLSLFVRNIGNEEGITGGLHETAASTRDQYFYVIRPRTIGLSFGYQIK